MHVEPHCGNGTFSVDSVAFLFSHCCAHTWSGRLINKALLSCGLGFHLIMCNADSRLF